MTSALFREGFWLFLFSASYLGSCLVMSCFCVQFPHPSALELQKFNTVLLYPAFEGGFGCLNSSLHS